MRKSRPKRLVSEQRPRALTPGALSMLFGPPQPAERRGRQPAGTPHQVRVSTPIASDAATGMERLWSRAVATGGNRWQMGEPPKGPKKAQTVAVGCDRLPRGVHGKEGVDGSSPSEGSAKAPHAGLFLSAAFARSPACARYGALYGAFSSRKSFSVAAGGGRARANRHPWERESAFSEAA